MSFAIHIPEESPGRIRYKSGIGINPGYAKVRYLATRMNGSAPRAVLPLLTLSKNGGAVPIRNIEREVDRILTLLRDHIHQRGLTQVQIQETLGWGRSYISQLLTQQKSIRFEQILMILDVLGVESAEFWGELYPSGQVNPRGAAKPRRVATPHRRVATPHRPAPFPFPNGDDIESGLRQIHILLDGIVRVLMNKGLITSDALEDAVAKAQERKKP